MREYARSAALLPAGRTPIGLRDRALIGLMVYSFTRIGAALSTKMENIYVCPPPLIAGTGAACVMKLE
jgi:hypothetical protein